MDQQGASGGEVGAIFGTRAPLNSQQDRGKQATASAEAAWGAANMEGVLALDTWTRELVPGLPFYAHLRKPCRSPKG